MTSVPSRSTRSHSPFPLLLLVTIPMLLAAACADKHIGRPCMTGLPTDNPNVSSVSAQALECPSRICLLPARISTDRTTGPFCTDYCSNDDDCSDAERRDPKTNPNGCNNNFVCRMAVGGLENNPIRCKKVCVCRDFVRDDDPNFVPDGCKN